MFGICESWWLPFFVSLLPTRIREEGDVHRLNDLSAYSGFKAVLTKAYTG
jgi:hypothetical protein